MQLESIPAELGTYLDISTGAAQLILSLCVILAIMIPTMILSRGSKSLIVESVMFFISEALLVAIGWLDSWVLIVTVMIIVLLWANLAGKLAGSE